MGQVSEIESVGQKCVGLQAIPHPWSLTHFALTTSAHAHWAEAEQPLEDQDLRSAIQKKLTEFAFDDQQLIVRSSAVHEALDRRGYLRSEVCKGAVESIIKAADVIWSDVEALARQETSPAEPVALIVQRYARPLLKGHLSNERRVSRTSDVWAYETGYQGPALKSQDTIRARNGLNPEAPIPCREVREVRRLLAGVAGYFTRSDVRFHLEWVWDGEELWVVQADPVDQPEGNEPGMRAPLPGGASLRREARAFTSALAIKGGWPKVEHVRTFAELGLPHGELFAIHGAHFLEAIMTGQIPEDVMHDLQTCFHYPLVVRTDVRGAEDEFMLPRTDAATDASEVAEFMMDTTRGIVESGADLVDLAFIAHTFIPTRVAAWSVGRPDYPLIQIDSTWGLPDGLQYYPHDSYVVDPDSQRIVSRDIRCKYEYLDCTESGEWVRLRTSQQWDWRPSLSEKHALRIAEITSRLVTHEGRALHVMFFADPRQRKFPEVLPWFYTESVDIDRLPNGPIPRNRFVIRDEIDLRDRENRKFPDGSFALDVQPDPSLLRKKDFLKEVADMSANLDVPVILHGTTLGHAYYLLRQYGARVLVPDMVEVPAEVQPFDKLVRDKIPQQIKERGERVAVHHVQDDELLQHLLAKAVEEAFELRGASTREDMLHEMADLFEVIKSVATTLGATLGEIESLASKKRDERGSFMEGAVLEATELPAPSHDGATPRLFAPPPDVQRPAQPNSILIRSGEDKTLNARQVLRAEGVSVVVDLEGQSIRVDLALVGGSIRIRCSESQRRPQTAQDNQLSFDL